MKKHLATLLIILMTIVVSSCSNIFEDVPPNYQDDTVILLNREVNTVQDAFDFANDRVYEWGAKAQKLYMVTVVFSGEQIEKQRGELEYQFCVDDGNHNYTANASVTIDMETDAMTSIYAWYDIRTKSRRLQSGYLGGWDTIKELDFSKWTVDIDEAFDIIYASIGDNAFSRFDNPKITLDCFEDKWIFYVTKENDTVLSTAVNNILVLNPITKEVTEIIGFGKYSTLL